MLVCGCEATLGLKLEAKVGSRAARSGSGLGVQWIWVGPFLEEKWFQERSSTCLKQRV